MDEPGWLTSPDPDLMLDFIQAKASDRKLRLFACACCRHVWHLIPPYHRRTVEVAERYADGLATREELTRSYQITADTPEDHEGDFDPAAEGDDYDPFVVPQPSNATTACADSSALEAARDTGYWCASLAAWTRPEAVFETEREAQATILRDLIGNPFRPVQRDLRWLTPTAVALAEGIYTDQALDRLPILADALQDAGCEDAELLNHCRSGGPHVRGCWVVDLVLGKEQIAVGSPV